MNDVGNGLWIAASASAVAALALTLIGRQQPPQRGWRLWQAALWLSTAGIVLGAALAPHPLAMAPARLALLAWPALCLVGMRRFHARVDWPGHERHDWAALGLCALLVASSDAWPADSAMASISAPAGALLMHLYAASLLVCAGSRRDARPMHLLGAIVALAAGAPMITTLPGIAATALFEAQAVTTALSSVAMAFVVTILVFDRSERHLRASRRRLRALASIDPLTQVPNRRHFESLASKALLHDPPASAVLMMFDLDHFKAINDHHGHAAGDRALRLVSRCVRDLLRVHDLPCRHGGDEFVLLLRHASVQDAMRVATRLVARVQSMAVQSALPTFSLSFGVVQVRPAEMLSQALQRADQALYEAKRQGRSRLVAAGGSGEQPGFIESRPLGLTHA
ncbi:MAG: GGDEF domain-containing protein [Rubrivivax sp.]|nr:GGDEF domain-containing protein [Rubrivivax sp.]MBK7263625.1 GGDEF domain-containing protein [Rubrivivax sp.]MBK8526858.1 GGDEF domain-containing protein [Rubrivivax sp.]